MENEKVKQLNLEWLKYTENVEKIIKEELIRSWVEEHGINVGDYCLIKDYRHVRKTDTCIPYYRKAKLVDLSCCIVLRSEYDNASYVSIYPIIKVYKKDNKTLINKCVRSSIYLEFFKMDFNLVGKDC